MTALRIFVRRGAIRRFHRLTRDSAGLPVSIEWDRRLSERRTDAEPAPADQRRSDRRNEPPYTWNTGEFVVVADPADEA
jgi:hypothetical protein